MFSECLEVVFLCCLALSCEFKFTTHRNEPAGVVAFALLDPQSVFAASKVQINNLPSPGLAPSLSAPGCARHSGKRLEDEGVGPAHRGAPIPPASPSFLPFPRAPETPHWNLKQRENNHKTLE